MRPQSGDRPDKPVAWWRVPIGVVAVAVIVLVFAQTAAGQQVMRRAGLEGPASSYTALSFTNPGALQGHLPLGHFSTRVGFALENDSQTSNHYQWTIQMIDGKHVTKVATGQATVGGGDTIDESRTVTGMCQSGNLKLVVSLAAPAESIDFMAHCGE